MSLFWCPHCVGAEKADEDVRHLERILPDSYTHLLCRHERLDVSVDVEKFRASLKLQLRTEEEVQKWLLDFQKSSSLTWRKSRTYPDSGRYNQYRVDLRCQHKTYTPSPRTSTKISKNTNCPATMFLVLKRQMQERKSRSGDPHMEQGYFLRVNLRNEHNHDLHGAEALRWRDVSEETINKLQQLYKFGHSPSSALKTIKINLKEEEGDNYTLASADRSVCPDLPFCYRLYHKLIQKMCPSIAAGDSSKDISEELFRPLELEQVWESSAVTADVQQEAPHTAGDEADPAACLTEEARVDVCEEAELSSGDPLADHHLPLHTHTVDDFERVCVTDATLFVSAVPIISTVEEQQMEENQPCTSSEEVVDSLDGHLEEIFWTLRNRLKADPSFSAPVQAFVSRFFQLKGDGALQAALLRFAQTGARRGGAARRRAAPGVRRASHRPPKSCRREHPYCSSSSSAAPDLLGLCLQEPAGPGDSHVTDAE